jgi:hypothetical protein
MATAGSSAHRAGRRTLLVDLFIVVLRLNEAPADGRQSVKPHALHMEAVGAIPCVELLRVAPDCDICPAKCRSAFERPIESSKIIALAASAAKRQPCGWLPEGYPICSKGPRP